MASIKPRRATPPLNATSLPQPIGRQREVLYLPTNGHTVVLGTAGSGKTTLAILRSLYLADPSTEHGGRTLLVTFNRCLVTYMQHLAGTIRRQVVVENYHRFARGYLSFRGKLPWGSICKSQERLRFIRLALHEGRSSGRQWSILQRSEEFFDEEFQWIQQHGITDAQSYVDANRVGRTLARVPKAERIGLFDIYKRYLTHRRQGEKLPDCCINARYCDPERRSEWRTLRQNSPCSIRPCHDCRPIASVVYPHQR